MFHYTLQSTKTTKRYNFRDPVVKRVVDKFRDRSNEGYRKYGTTLHEERTTKMKGLMKYLLSTPN